NRLNIDALLVECLRKLDSLYRVARNHWYHREAVAQSGVYADRLGARQESPAIFFQTHDTLWHFLHSMQCRERCRGQRGCHADTVQKARRKKLQMFNQRRGSCNIAAAASKRFA